jgi:hypothetical protein
MEYNNGRKRETKKETERMKEKNKTLVSATILGSGKE